MDALRHISLCLRDLTDTEGIAEASVRYQDGSLLSYDTEDGLTLITPVGGHIDLTDDWADYAGLLPADGVESVRDQFVTLAQKRGADV